MTHPLIDADDTYLRGLESRLTDRLVVFRDVEMPHGVIPPRSRVGIERTPDGQVVLRVDRPVTIPDLSPTVREWLHAGELRFARFRDLVTFVRGDLAAATGPLTAAVTGPAPTDPALPSIDEIGTDPRVLAALQGQITRIVVDEATLYEGLTADIRGQDRAMRILARTVSRHTRKANRRRPLSIFMLGPTGTGKTSSSLALATLLGSESHPRALLRLDMNEYKEQHRISQLLGAPQGYIGHAEGATLTNFLTAHPDGIVLFDEIEKSHPDILEALMNLMDAGRLSTPTARPGAGDRHQIDAHEAILLFTSNHPVEDLLSRLNEQTTPTELNAMCRTLLVAHNVAPAVASRVGTYLVFEPLTSGARAEVMWLAVTRVAAEYGLDIVGIDAGVIAALLRISTDTRFGARSLESIAEEELGDVFADTAQTGTYRLDGPPYRLDGVHPTH